jgi:hypothetical protein
VLVPPRCRSCCPCLRQGCFVAEEDGVDGWELMVLPVELHK